MESGQLLAWVRDDFGVELDSVERVHEGADINATVWRGTTVTGSQYAVKWSSGGNDAGPLVTAYLADHRVPAPTRTCDGRLWSTRDKRRLSLRPWIEGARAAESTMTEQHWTAYGELLARVHATEPTAELTAVLATEHYDHERMSSLARTIEHRLRTKQPADPLEQALKNEWETSHDIITELISEADELEAEVRTKDAPSVICHADAHLGNVLLGPGDAVWLIDWDDVRLAPRERDLLFVLGQLGNFGTTNDQQRRWFFNGYGPVQIDQKRLAYFGRLRALEDVATWSDQVLHGPDREEALEVLRGVLGRSLSGGSVRHLGHTLPPPGPAS